MNGARSFIAVVICLIVAASSSYSQLYFRSAKSGNWQDTLTWEKSTDRGSTWQQSSTIPSGSEHTLIQSPHSVVLNSSLTVTDTRIDGQLTVPSGTVMTASGGVLVDTTINPAQARPSRPSSLGGVSLYGALTVQGEIVILGPSFYASRGSSVVYSGTASQTIAAITYGSLELNNPAGATLAGGIWVQGSLTIARGNLSTGSYTLELLSSATVSEAAPFKVLGMLHTARTCTLGVSESFGGMGVEIARSGGPFSIFFSVTRYTGIAPSIENVETITRSFDISPSINSRLSASLVFRYTADELNGASETALQLYKSSGSVWTKAGGSVNTASHSLSLTGIDSFSSWAVGAPIPVPLLSSISPSSGSRGSTMNVAITATNLEPAVTNVGFSGRGIIVNSVTFPAATRATANISISSSAPTGFRDVSVNNSYGTGRFSNVFQVTNPPPTLMSISPASSAQGQSLSVTIRGGGFDGGVTTTSFGQGITVRSVSVESPQEMVVQLALDAGATLGGRTVTVTNTGPGGGSASLTSSFTVLPPPKLAAIAPRSGTRGRSVSVTFSGSNFFTGSTLVGMGDGITVDSLTVLSNVQLKVHATISYAATAGLRDVWVSNTGGSGAVTLAGAFGVSNPLPGITGISPAVASRGKTVTITVSGSDFISGVTNIGLGSGVAVGSVNVLSPTQLAVEATIPRDAVIGARDITVTNTAPGGGSAKMSGGFFVQNPAPVLVSIAPASGLLGQTLPVVLTGTCLMSGVSSANFGPGIAINSVSVDTGGSSMMATITISQSTLAGLRTVSVANAAPGGGVGQLANAFTILNPSPTLASISPAGAGKGQTLNVSLGGSNFVAGVTTATFGAGITVNSVTVSSATSASASITVSPGALVGARGVTVSNPSPGGGNATLSSVFSVEHLPPTLSSIMPTSGSRGSLMNIVLVGTNFLTPGTSLTMGPGITINATTAVSTTQLSADILIAPDAALGSRTVSVTNPLPGGGISTLPAAFSVTAGAPTYIEAELGTVPDQFVLSEAFPNPFNPSTKIRYGLPENSDVTLDIHNMLGNTVAELVRGERSKGMFEMNWHPANLPSGVYLIRMHAVSLESSKRFISSRKVMLMK